MSEEVKVPDIGDFDDVDVIEIHVEPGDEIEPEDPLITLETDKASMDVPAPRAGKVVEVAVSVGDKVSEGSVILTLEAADGDRGEAGEDESAAPHGDDDDDTGDGNGRDKDEADAKAGGEPAEAKDAETESDDAGRDGGDKDAGAGKAAEKDGRWARDADDAAASGKQGAANGEDRGELVVIGSGPGGYAAAFRAADLGMSVTLVERYGTLGGVCLNVGCIPSKALLHVAEVIENADAFGEHGVVFGEPEIDAQRLGDWKDKVVGRLTGGLAGMAKKRGVTVLQGSAKFAGANRLTVETGDGTETVDFGQCIIAAGSEAAMLPDLPEDERIVDSTGALELAPLPASLLVVGGGIIGLEMACVYDALGVEVSVVELTDGLMPGTDPDLVRPLAKRIGKRYKAVMTGTKVAGMEASDEGIRVSFEGDDAPEPAVYERVLIAVGRRPNGKRLDADKAGVEVDDRGYIPVDKEMRTNVSHIFAVGDIAREPMLAHKATHEGHVAAEVAAGEKRAFDARAIPSVAYTDPEIAWAGVTEQEAKEQGLDYGVGKFPWAASGRALAIGRDEGFTKILFDKDTDRVIGAGIVGPHAGDLISELALAIEMGADAVDLGRTIHPHPTLSETVGLAAEVWEGVATDIYMPKRRPSRNGD